MSPKIFHFLCILMLLLAVSYSLPAQSIAHADSLFKENKFQQAYKNYQSTLKTAGNYSPRMLLRMAYIKETQGDYTQAVYFLNTLYHYNSNRKVRNHLEQIAQVNHLEGYTFSDLDIGLNLFARYYQWITGGMVFLCLLVLASAVQARVLRKPLVYRPVILILSLAAALALLNFSRFYHKGIIGADGTWLMEGPSGGSKPLFQVAKGHRVTITAHNDVWYRVIWQGKECWVNNRNLLLLPE